MKTRTIFLLLAAVAFPVLFAFTAPPFQVPTSDRMFTAALQDFGLALFKQIVQSEKTKNVFVSPSSVAVALAMTYNGARGETQKSMARALKLDGMTPDAINSAAYEWLKTIQNPAPKVELSIANSIWLRNGVPLQSQFVQRIERNYDGTITTLDFNKRDAAGIINDWVKAKTKDKIDQIVPEPISADRMMFLINALYFKGQWSSRFDPKQTHDAAFALLNGTTVNIPTMSRTGGFETRNGDGYQTIRMRYGDGRFSMFVFVPAEGKTVHDLAGRLTPALWRAMTADLVPSRAPLLMPKFTFKYDITLNDVLKSLGMANAFDPQSSDLSGMVEPDWLRANRLYISEVKHKTFVEVNEEGTEAAASTSVGISVTSAPVPITVNRPFLVAIHDSVTNVPLFLGMVLDPRAR